MSRITNLTSLRIKRFNSWKSNWVETNKNYSLLFFYDFQVHQYLRGLFYRLRILTDDFYIDHLLNDFFYIKVNAFFYRFNIYDYVLYYFFDQYLFYDFFFFFSFLRWKNFDDYFYKFFYYFFFFNQKIYFHFFYYMFLLWFDFFQLNWNDLRKNFFDCFFLRNQNQYFFDWIESNFFFYQKKNWNVGSFFYRKYQKRDLNSFFDIFYKKNFYDYLYLSFFYFYFFKFFLCFGISFFLYHNFFFYFFFKILKYFLKKIKLFFSLLSFFSFFDKGKKKFFWNDFLFLKKNYQYDLERDVFDKKNYFDFFFYFFFYYLIFNIEKTIYFFYGSRCFFNLFFYSYSLFPSFLSSKFVNDYVLFELEKGKSLYVIFKNLQFYQLKEKSKLKEDLNYFFINFFRYFLNYSSKKKLKTYKKIIYKFFDFLIQHYHTFYDSWFSSFFSFFKELLYYEVLKKKYPLIGLRIECNGTFKKGEQANLVAYHHIVKDYKLFGKMPNRSILSDIDYYQSFARTTSGSIGIKVWIFFYTKSYNSKYWLNSLV